MAHLIICIYTLQKGRTKSPDNYLPLQYAFICRLELEKKLIG